MAYLRDRLLRTRLLDISSAVADHLRGPSPLPLTTLMGSRIDVLKLFSSMTLFEHAARELRGTEERGSPGPSADLGNMERVAGEILAASASQGIPPCESTRSRIEGDARGSLPTDRENGRR